MCKFFYNRYIFCKYRVTEVMAIWANYLLLDVQGNVAIIKSV